MTTDTDFLRAGPSDVEAAADTLASAFADYAWTRWTVDHDGHRDRLRAVQALCLGKVSLPHGLVLVSADAEAVIALNPPDIAERVDSSVWDEVAGLSGERWTNAVNAVLPEPSSPHSWELATVGVRPARQGQGLGGRIVEAALSELGAIPVHLRTSEECNVAFYRRHGFDVFATTETGGPVVWSMQRS
ncbi:GNAT family N-acetyltransferase [Salininema proteolyticum]|uniref:GNAT family N-acetyltransferase n=1 Tax=Salininema proteolyticum TaxID=1607685 RepID=A0ABV8TT92_9ACTN